MTMTDPIADMLTRIRNGSQARHEQVDIPASKLKEEIARLLKREGFIRDYRRVDDRTQGNIRVYLKYGPDREEVFGGLERVSKPGSRVLVGVRDVPRVLGGLGMAIVSTSRGVLSGKECREQGVGGEILARVW